MKDRTPSEVKVVKWDEHIRARPELYYGEGGATPEMVIDFLDYVAKTLGAVKTHHTHLDGWWYFCADIDWMFKSTLEIESVRDVFFGWKPLPESKSPNSYRCEVLCTPVSSDIYTVVNSEIEVIKGNAPDKEVISVHFKELGNWGRIVGFKFNNNL